MAEVSIYNEENIAILIADLTGYSALTETHGAISAADMIDSYVHIVENSLAGDCYLHETTGDEVMIVSSSAEYLLATAQNLIRTSSGKNRFLQVHGGLHYGSILKRHNKFFGTAINLAARIAAKANPGTIWCSQDFIQSLDPKQAGNFRSTGKHFFKNINGTNEIFELIAATDTNSTIDPVCKMRITEKHNAIAHPLQKHLFFCDTTCLDIYSANNAYQPDLVSW